MAELPPKGAVLKLIGDDEAKILSAETSLRTRGYLVDNTILWSNEIQESLSHNDLLELGNQKNLLWCASPCLS